MDMVARLGGEIYVASTQGSLPARFLCEDGYNIFPLHLSNNGTIAVSFGWVLSQPQLEDESRRREILERFHEAVSGL
jgi:hypothetical protein